MGNVQKDQHGFIVEAFLVVLVIAVIGFGGYYVWHAQQHKSSSATTSSK